jgi:hypothetical protein
MVVQTRIFSSVQVTMSPGGEVGQRDEHVVGRVDADDFLHGAPWSCGW